MTWRQERKDVLRLAAEMDLRDLAEAQHRAREQMRKRVPGWTPERPVLR